MKKSVFLRISLIALLTVGFAAGLYAYHGNRNTVFARNRGSGYGSGYCRNSVNQSVDISDDEATSLFEEYLSDYYPEYSLTEIDSENYDSWTYYNGYAEDADGNNLEMRINRQGNVVIPYCYYQSQ